jgi:hypothetical protein
MALLGGQPIGNCVSRGAATATKIIAKRGALISL